MKTSKVQARKIPTITDWEQAVDPVNYAKGTDIEVVKATKYAVPKKGAQPLFKYKNRKGNIGDWYAKVDVTITEKPKNGAVKVTKPATEKEELTEFARIAKKYGIAV